MTVERAQRAVQKAEAQRAKARESFVQAVIKEAGANPRKVQTIEVGGFLALLRTLRG